MRTVGLVVKKTKKSGKGEKTVATKGGGKNSEH